MTSRLFPAILILCIIAAACPQSISLGDVLAGDQKPLTPNCLKADSTGACILCADNFHIQATVCVAGAAATKPPVPAAEASQIVPDGFVPCNGSKHCGESQTFSDSNELQVFLMQHGQKPLQAQQAQVQQAQQAQQVQQAQVQISSLRVFEDSRPALVPSPPPPNVFSVTNNQVDGVDEADLLKNDGTYIYTISGKKLSIVRAFPVSNAAVLSTIDLSTFNPTALFIQGEYLAVFGNKEQAYTFCQSAPGSLQSEQNCINFTNPSTLIRIYDIRSRSAPSLIKNLEIDGTYFNGRKTSDGWIYILAKQSVYQRNNPFPWYNLGSQQIFIGSSSLFFYPKDYAKPVFANILAFNLRNPYAQVNNNAISIIIEDAQVLYMSEKAIYMSYSRILDGKNQTDIHKIFASQEKLIPFADGRVEGMVSNQFWMDQYESFLRVAAVVWEGNNRVSSSVYCLNNALGIFGQIKNIAPNEIIKSARFVDRRLYLVTFRVIDPFFVISFPTHNAPTILGQLKITGYSSYLHPYDENTIIGLGREAVNQQQQLGLKIALFDVRDVTNPKQAASFDLKEKEPSSIAEFEHKAFLFSKEKNLLVIPGKSAASNFNGVFVFYVTASEIRVAKTINHFKVGDDFEARSVQRDLYINNYLYSKSQCLISIFDLNDYSRYQDISISC